MSTQMATPTEKKSLVKAFASKYEVEEKSLLATLKKTFFKSENISNEQMMSILLVAKEYDFNPFIKEIHAALGKGGEILPIVGIDGWTKIRNKQPMYAGIEFKYSPNLIKIKDCQIYEWCDGTIYYKEDSLLRPITIREFGKECFRDTSAWRSHPNRMLRHKAHIQVIRAAFGIGGIYDRDEAERIKETGSYDIENVSYVNVEPVQPVFESKASALAQKYKSEEEGGVENDA